MKKKLSERERDVDSYDDGRTDDLRDYESRESDGYHELDMKHVSPTYIPPEIIPAGMKYLYLRHSVKGTPDDFNISRMYSKNWRPVPASRHPELKNIDLFNRNQSLSDYIVRGDVILCERPIKDCEAESAHYSNINNEKLRSANTNILRAGGFEIINNSKTEFSRGQMQF